MTKKYTLKEFIKKAKDIHNNKYDYNLVEYINSRTKIQIICNTCKNIFEQLPKGHLSGHGCRICMINNHRLTNDIFIKKSKEIHNNLFDYSLTVYIDVKSKVKIKCNSCNIIFEQFPNNHLDGNGCKICSIKKITDTLSQFINKAIEIHKHDFDYILVEYINSITKVKIKCNTCKNIFEQIPSSHLQGAGCLDCTNKSRASNTKEFINKANLIHKDKYDYNLVEYVNSFIKIQIKCIKCLTIFEQSPNGHLSGNGCPKCNFSKGELKCEQILKNIECVKEIISQFRFDDCRNKLPLPFDFKVIFNNKYFLIEFNGKQHYDPTTLFSHDNLEDIQKRDKIKYDYCKNNNIDLLVIKYTYFNNIENIIKNFIEILE